MTEIFLTGLAAATVQLFVWLFVFRYFATFWHPASLNSFLWLLLISAHFLIDHGMTAISFATAMLVSASSVAFSIGAIISSPRAINASPIILEKNGKLSLVPKIYLIITFLLTYPVWTRAQELAAHGTTGNFLTDVRITLTNPDFDGSYGLLAYATPIAFAALFILVANTKYKLASPVIIAAFFLCVFYASMGTGRTYFFNLVISSAVIVQIRRPNTFSVKFLILVFGALIGFFIGIGSVLGKMGSANIQFFQIFSIYFFGGLSAFSEWSNEFKEFSFGAETFRFFFAILNRIGFDVEVVGLVKEFTYVPFPTNVYTVFRPYYEDFGVLFVLISQFFLGLLGGYFFRKSKNRSERFSIFYGLFIYAMSMQFFQDAFFSLLSTWIFYYILISLAYVKVRKNS